MVEYDPGAIEKKWQSIWLERGGLAFRNSSKKIFYCLDMLFCPTESGFHIGHLPGYIATDIVCRYKQTRGFSVLHPIGFNAFGLAAEQHAVETGEHPETICNDQHQVFRDRVRRLGLSVDWTRETIASDEGYFRWTQWIFIKFYDSWYDNELQKARPIDELPIPEEIDNKGHDAVREYRDGQRLAYYGTVDVNWCPALGRVLANEEVSNGKSKKEGFEVVRKSVKQWMLRITSYAERLLNDFDEVDCSESIKQQQRNWIGRSIGVEIQFKVEHRDFYLKAFTTRPDTLFGVTFFAVAPEHQALDRLVSKDRREQVEKFCSEAKKLSEVDRCLTSRKKTGIFTGSYVINPITREPIPVYVGDYVPASLGNGAVIGVPSHDDGDFDFARTYQIDIRPVVMPLTEDIELLEAVIEGEISWSGPGRMLPCEFPAARRLGLLNTPNQEAAEKISNWLVERGVGSRIVNYRLRDWVFSRQRYWGEPIPVVHWEDGTVTTLSDAELPLKLPLVVGYRSDEAGESPLVKAEDWLWVIDEKTGKRGRRETDTMPQWAGPCWFHLRALDPQNLSNPWNQDLEKRYLPVDLYVGGAEHAVMQLLYTRFWHKVLFDLGYLSSNEPFKRLHYQGAVLNYAYRNKVGVLVAADRVKRDKNGVAHHHRSNEKLEQIPVRMSEHLGNLVDFDQIIARYGADTLRLYLMFISPLDQDKVWDEQAIIGCARFLKRAWRFCLKAVEDGQGRLVDEGEEGSDVRQAISECVKKVSCDIEKLRFNTAISAMMAFLRFIAGKDVSRRTVESFVTALYPFAPHLAEEVWSRLGHDESI